LGDQAIRILPGPHVGRLAYLGHQAELLGQIEELNRPTQGQSPQRIIGWLRPDLLHGPPDLIGKIRNQSLFG
jgi:hypothetical protein